MMSMDNSVHPMVSSGQVLGLGKIELQIAVGRTSRKDPLSAAGSFDELEGWQDIFFFYTPSQAAWCLASLLATHTRHSGWGDQTHSALLWGKLGTACPTLATPSFSCG